MEGEELQLASRFQLTEMSNTGRTVRFGKSYSSAAHLCCSGHLIMTRVPLLPNTGRYTS